MNIRPITIILIVVLVLIGAGAAYLWLTDTKIPNPWAKETNTANTAVTTNTTVKNQPAVTNSTLPIEVKGDTAFSGTITVGTVKLTLSSLQRTNKFADITAGEGKTLLMVYIDPVLSSQVSAVVNGISGGVNVEYQGGAAALRRYKVAGDQPKNDRGFFLFEIPSNATQIFLVRGVGPTAERVAIPAAK